MDVDDIKERLIALAEDRVKVAESLGLSVSGVMAEVLSKFLSDEIHDIPDILHELDQRIQEARQAQ